MSEDMSTHPEPTPDMRVGFRDIYRAVGESESRIKEHVSLVLLPITQAVADHETRIRAIEDNEVTKAREAYELATDHEARLGVLEGERKDAVVVRAERKRLLGLSNKGLGIIIVVVNTLATVGVLLYNYVAGIKP